MRFAIATMLVVSSARASDPWLESSLQEAPAITLAGTLSKADLDALTHYGESLFSARFTSVDGVGRPMATQAIIPTKRKQPPEHDFFRTAGMDAGSCVACHNQPRAGGAGDFVTNVFVSEGFESADFDNLDPQFSNERGTNHLFGAGLIELLAREMTADLHEIRQSALAQARRGGKAVNATLVSKGIHFGRVTAMPDGVLDLSDIDGVDTDLVIRPFSQKGVMTSLRQFTVNALNHHHGMQATERFGARWTGEIDFDEDGHDDEITTTQVSALVAWQASQPPPIRIEPQDAEWRTLAEHGEHIFDQIGCGECHIKALPLSSLAFADPGPLDAAGTLSTDDVDSAAIYDLALMAWAEHLPRNGQGDVLVPLFGDLKRHDIADQQVSTFGNELLPQRFVDRNVFMTSELWGLASTGPYGHRNDLTTIDQAIRAHGGEGRAAREAYIRLDEADRQAGIAFLKTLLIE